MQFIILGSAQDAGIPQIGCYCKNCNNARNKLGLKRLGPSAAFFDKEKNFCYLLDASPDIKYQIDIINKTLPNANKQSSLPIKGVFLTHSHFGHCSGLWSLGLECINAKEIQVFCTEKMGEFLKNNHPFKQLFSRKNLSLFSMKINYEYPLENFNIKAIKVPHREEFSDTVCFLIKGTKELLYLPDIDYWTTDLIKLVKNVDIAFIDGTFYSKDDIPHMDKVPHPPIIETMGNFHRTSTEIYFTHFNHTNPILPLESLERKNVLEKGFKIAEEELLIEF